MSCVYLILNMYVINIMGFPLQILSICFNELFYYYFRENNLAGNDTKEDIDQLLKANPHDGGESHNKENVSETARLNRSANRYSHLPCYLAQMLNLTPKTNKVLENSYNVQKLPNLTRRQPFK